MVDWPAPWLVVSPVAFVLVNGVLEVGFGAAIPYRWTAAAAGVAAVSPSATVAYLAVVGLVDGGRATCSSATSASRGSGGARGRAQMTVPCFFAGRSFSTVS